MDFMLSFRIFNCFICKDSLFCSALCAKDCRRPHRLQKLGGCDCVAVRGVEHNMPRPGYGCRTCFDLGVRYIYT